MRSSFTSSCYFQKESEDQHLKIIKKYQFALNLKRKKLQMDLKNLNSLVNSEWIHDVIPYWRQRHSPWINDFGYGLQPHEVKMDVPVQLRFLERRMRQLAKKSGEATEVLEPTTGKHGFQVCVDVHQFKPKEITVKAVDHSVIIEAKHEERQDEHGFISREFRRRYILPEGYDAKTVTSELSTDGIMTVRAPLP